MENLRARAQAAEEAAREAYVVETEAEDASWLADGAAKRLAVTMEELTEKMKLRLRWVLSCEKRAGRSETADWRKEFAVPEGVGATKIKATCRSARGAFGASWRKLEEATLALGRVQNFASHLAWQWHTAMEGAREASMLGSSLWGHLPGTKAKDMVEYFDDASKVLLADMYMVERRFATERQMAKEGTLLGMGFRTDPNPRFGGSSSGSSSDSSSGSEEAEPKATGEALAGSAAAQAEHEQVAAAEAEQQQTGAAAADPARRGPARQKRDAMRAAAREAAGGGALEAEREQARAEKAAAAVAEEKAPAAAEPQAEIGMQAELEEAELEVQAELEEAEQLAAVEAVAVAVALEAVAEWETEADWEEALAAREATAREEATATPDGRAADGQTKVFDPGGCVPLAAAGGGGGGGVPPEAARGAAGGGGRGRGRASVELSADWLAQFGGVWG